jgi:hypothetical protein
VGKLIYVIYYQFGAGQAPGNGWGDERTRRASAWNAIAGTYLNAYNRIMADELYNVYPQVAYGFNTAFNVLMNYIGTGNGGGSSCPYNTGSLKQIPPP